MFSAECIVGSRASPNRPQKLVRALLFASGWCALSLAQVVSALVFEQALGQNVSGAIVANPVARPVFGTGLSVPLGYSQTIDTRNNGQPDLFLCHASFGPPNPKSKQPCAFLRPQADGSLIDVTRQLIGAIALPSVEHSRQIVIADFNNDGYPDIFVGAHGYDTSPYDGETNLLLISNGDGTYSDRSSTLPQAPDFTHSACVGDFDGDGNLDIFVGNLANAAQIGPYLLIGRGDGTFAQRIVGLPASITGLAEGFTTCATVDVDLDGNVDLVLGTFGGPGPPDSIVLFNDGHGDFTRRARYVLPQAPLPRDNSLMLDIASLDVNGDGYPDLIVLASNKLTASGFALQVLINRQDGTFADETSVRFGPSTNRTTGPWCSFIPLLDLDGDGSLDLYCYTFVWDSSLPRYWLNDRRGAWTPVVPDPLPAGASNGLIYAVDFDGDGRPDLLRVDPTSTGDVVYRSFLNRTPRTVPSPPIMRAAAPGNGLARVTFAKPLNNGPSPVIQYTTTCGTGRMGESVSASSATSPAVIGGLTNGRLYRCSTKAVSASGTSLPSNSATVRPTAPATTVMEALSPDPMPSDPSRSLGPSQTR